MQTWLKENPKFTLLFQPVDSPWVNNIEKLWHALHETVTRNHKCLQMWQITAKNKTIYGNSIAISRKSTWHGEAVADLGSVI